VSLKGDPSRDMAKRAVGEAAARLIHDGMTVGLGTGTTAAFFHEALAARIKTEGLRIMGVATSGRAEDAAIRLGIPLVPLTPRSTPDITIDGADELNDSLQLIKGGGGALLREKLVAMASKELVVIADSSKRVPYLGGFPLPIVAVPFAVPMLIDTLSRDFEVTATWRENHHGVPMLSDDGLAVLDLPFGVIRHPALMEERLRHLPGVVEVGLFIGIATRALLARDDGTVQELLPAAEG
jgi:ribose 5-phosphate isomerase A